MWIEVKTNNGPIVIGVIYRYPTTLVNDYESFSTNLCDMFADLRDSNTAFYVVGNYQRWSPRGRPWPRGRPRGHILKSLALASKVKSLALALASKPQVLENCPVLGSRTILFFKQLKFR